MVALQLSFYRRHGYRRISFCYRACQPSGRTFAERGADVRQAEFDDPGTLPAMKGGERMLQINIAHVGSRMGRHCNVLEAGGARGAQHIVYTSLIFADRPDNLAVLKNDHPATRGAKSRPSRLGRRRAAHRRCWRVGREYSLGLAPAAISIRFAPMRRNFARRVRARTRPRQILLVGLLASSRAPHRGYSDRARFNCNPRLADCRAGDDASAGTEARD
ncbi:hypothetical protein HNQ99_001464 [Rhizorhapis suberifaciens]|uniref:NAD(P)-binding domain-containing protein n=1 Tax=Rhizorhapis suberifaciens TaxID=13656 RepID=A0A840HU82_9SPHN|nr:hypothetical protein [Rhizorhapis suberifaciens]